MESDTNEMNTCGAGVGEDLGLHLLCLPMMLMFFVQCSECLWHAVLFPSNYYVREIESQETPTLSKRDGNNEDGAGSLRGWGEEQHCIGNIISRVLLKTPSCPLPATWNSASSIGPESFLGRMGECLIPHTCSLLQCKLTQGLASWSGPEVGPFQRKVLGLWRGQSLTVAPSASFPGRPLGGLCAL